MQLTNHTDYALRLLIYLFVHESGSASVAQIAQAYDISTNHLAKVAGALARHGWIRSRRGHGGGLSLLPAASELTVGEVVRTLEQNLQIVECFREDSTCPIEPACGLKAVMQQASEAFLTVLDGYRLADFVKRPIPLRRLLNLV